ncbi:MAG: molybdenum cofactor biosynthesis protein, partial [Thermoprotei archaeon]
DKVDVVVTIGGTGLSATDVTIESLKPVFDKEVEGFGDVFRSISFREIGATSYMSRATAGVIAGKVIYCLPGSPHAVKVAIKELILPEAGHLVYIARRDLR